MDSSTGVREAKKDQVLNVRVSIDERYALQKQALARGLKFSQYMRSRLLSADSSPIPVQSTCNQVPEASKEKGVESAGPKLSARALPENGRCSHGFSVYKSMTACPECKKL